MAQPWAKSANFLKYGVIINLRRISGVDTNHLSSELQNYKGVPVSLTKGINREAKTEVDGQERGGKPKRYGRETEVDAKKVWETQKV